VVVLNYNQAHLTERCVRALLQQQGVNLVICVVDNGSTDSSAVYLPPVLRNLGVYFLPNPTGNVGYAAGNNMGLRHLTKMGVEWLVVANPDTVPAGCYTVREMVEAAATTGGLAFWGPAICTHTGRIVEPYTVRMTPAALAFEPLTRAVEIVAYRLRVILRKDLRYKPQRVYRLYGCWIMASREAWQAVGYFDEGTFLYYEEVLLAERCRRLGIDMYYFPGCTIVHEHASSQSEPQVCLHEVASRAYLLRTCFGCSPTKVKIVNTINSFCRSIARLASHG
jgi:GT2 family glycosyltransferase